MGFLKVQGQRLNYDIDNYVGRAGTVFYGPDDGIFRLSDGVTPGGISLGSGGGEGGFVLPVATTTRLGGVKIDGSTISINNQVISVLNGVFTTESYANPSFITSLAYSKLTGAPTLSTVATTGSYNDLLNRPTLFSGSYNDLTNKPNFATVATTGSYNDLINRPTLVTSYNQLTDLPNLFSGSYADLTNKPVIPTDISQLTDTQGLLGSGGSGSGTTFIQNPYAFNIAGDDSSLIEITNGNTVQFKGVNITVTTTADGIVTFTGPAAIQGDTGPAGADGADGDDGASAYEVAVSNGFSGSELEWLASLIGPQGEPGIQGDKGDKGDTGDQGLQGDKGDKGDTGDQGLQGVGVVTAIVNESGNLIITLTDTSTVDAGSVTANTGNINFTSSTIGTVDSSGLIFGVASTFNSDLTIENDLIVVNEIRSSTGEIYVTESFVMQAVNELIGAAPEALNTLQELAAALGNDANFATTLLEAVSAATNTVRYDISNQGLTEIQKQNARTNIGAISEAEMYAAAIIM